MLAEALETNTTLTNLFLERCDIGEEGAKMISEPLKTNTSLLKLWLHSDEIEVNGNKQ